MPQMTERERSEEPTQPEYGPRQEERRRTRKGVTDGPPIRRVPFR
jgi:hypothetical protein